MSMDIEQELQKSEHLKQILDDICHQMLKEGHGRRPIIMALLLQAFDLFLDEGQDPIVTREVFLPLAGFATQKRLADLGITLRDK